jgi:hypothetical protein
MPKEPYKAMFYIKYDDGRESYVTSIIHSEMIEAENQQEATSKSQILIGHQVNNHEFIGPLIGVTKIKTKA